MAIWYGGGKIVVVAAVKLQWRRQNCGWYGGLARCIYHRDNRWSDSLTPSERILTSSNLCQEYSSDYGARSGSFS